MAEQSIHHYENFFKQFVNCNFTLYCDKSIMRKIQFK